MIAGLASGLVSGLSSGLVPGLAATLLRASIAGAVVAGGVWLLCRLAPQIPARVRTALWWLVCLKLLVGCVWLSPVELPLLPADTIDPAALAATSGSPSTATGVPPRASDSAAPSPLAGRPAGAPEPGALPGFRAAGAPAVDGPAPLAPLAPLGLASTLPAALIPSLILLWGLGVAAGAAVTTVQAVRLARTVRSARPVTGGPVADRLSELLERLGSTRRPDLRTTDRVTSPQAVGLLRPTILLPPGALAAPRDEQIMMLCHELVHLERRDPWLAWIPLLARRLFFFHPLAALAQREFVLAREAACDVEVLRLVGAAPRAYGRLLLRWGVAPRETGLAAAGAAPSVQDLKRRLQMLERSTRSARRTSPWWWLAALTLVLGLVPVTIVAQAPPAPSAPRAETPAPPAPVAKAAPADAPAAAPAPPRAAAAPVAISARADAPAPAAVALAAPTAVAPRRPGIAAPPPPPAAPTEPVSGSDWVWSDDGDGQSYALLLEGDHMVLHGHLDSADHVRALRADDRPLLWFRHDGAEYVVRDPATIDRAKQIVKPQIELGHQQGELGQRQGELGGRQGELGAQQGRLGAQQAELGARQAALAAAAANGDETARSTRKQDHRDLADQMRELSERQRELGRRQKELGERQRELGTKQKELGERQREAADKAQHEMDALIDQVLARGLAERVD